MRGWLLVVLMAGAPASAQDASCEPTDEPEFRGLVLQSQAAIDRGDVELNAQIQHELEERLPCLVFAPPPRLWADYLVTVAIGSFVAGKPWQPALFTALQIRPGVDRGVSGAHPIARWEPPPAEPSAEPTPVPSGVLLYIDGLPAETLPPTQGMHLVQRRDGKWWASTIVVDEAIPSDFLTTAAEGPPRIILEGHVGLGFGMRATGQDKTTRDGDVWESDFIAGAGARFPLSGHMRGSATFFSPIGVAGELSHPIRFSGGLQVDARATAIYKPKRNWWGAGVGIVALDLWEGVPGGYPAYRDQVNEDSAPDQQLLPETLAESGLADQVQLNCSIYCWRVELMAYPQVSGQLRGPAKRPWDIGGTFGFRPGLMHLVGSAGLPLRERDSGQRLRLGTQMVITSALMQQKDLPANQLRVTELRLGAELSLLLGEP